MGNHPEHLVSLVDPGRPAAVIANAIDYGSDEEREEGLRRELDALAELEIDAEELDLRTYFDRPERLARDLRRYGLVWLRGGNVFLLRHALAASGADAVFAALLEEDALVYGDTAPRPACSARRSAASRSPMIPASCGRSTASHRSGTA